MKNIILYLTLALLIFSCKEKGTKGNVINLDNIENISINELFKETEIVQLETNDSCLIADVTKTIYYNNCIYILDIKQQALFCFDKNGNFNFKIHDRGEGPKEYLYLSNFNIDPYNKQIILLVPFGKLCIYDLNGNFISYELLPSEVGSYNEVFAKDENTIIFTSLNKNQLFSYSRENKNIDKIYFHDEIHVKENVFSLIDKVFNFNNDLYFSPPLSNKIINLNNNDIYSWDFNNNNSEKQIKELRKYLEKENPELSDLVGKQKINYNILFNYESNLYKISIIDYGNFNFRHIFFNKQTNKSHVFDKTIENIRFFHANFCGEYVIMFNNHISNKLDLTYYSETSLTQEQQLKIAQHNPDTDNPLLVIYTLKQE